MSQIKLTEAFRLFDKDGDGFIDLEEFKPALLSYGCYFGEDTMEELIGDQIKWDLNSFLSIAVKAVEGKNPKDIMMMNFKEFDNDNDGTISTEELKAVLCNLADGLSSQEINDFIKMADPTDSGKAYYEKLTKFLLD